MQKNKNRSVVSTVYLGSAYLPPVQYFSKLCSYENAVVEQYDHYTKQTYRNRCHIAGPGGVQALSVPIVKPDKLKCPMKDIRISDHGNWRHSHWNAIESAYNSTPFYEYYKDDFRPFYTKKIDFLTDFNEELICLVASLIDMELAIERTSEYKTDYSGEIDFREIIHPKRDYRQDIDFAAMPYYQVFKDRHGFLPNLSIIDLLFNMGPESLIILQNSIIPR